MIFLLQVVVYMFFLFFCSEGLIFVKESITLLFQRFMKKYLFVLLFLPLMWVGCEDPDTLDRKAVVKTEDASHGVNKVKCSFWLSTEEASEDVVATVFKEGETITMHYTIDNVGDSALCCIAIDCCDPAVGWLNTVEGWGDVYRSSDDALMPNVSKDAHPGYPYTAACYGSQGYPSFDSGERLHFKTTYPNALEKGQYYVLFKTAVVYRDKCSVKYPDYDPTYDGEPLTYVNQSFRIDFEVQ